MEESNAAKVEKYKRLMRQFLDWNEEHVCDFTALVLEHRKIDHNAYNDGDSDLGFRKFLGRTYIAMARKYEPRRLRMVHGYLCSRRDIAHMPGILNSMRRHQKGMSYRPFGPAQWRPVQDLGGLQLADVLLGAVAWEWNGRGKKHPNSPKQTVADYLRAEGPADSLGTKTPPNMANFHTWPFRLQDTKARAPRSDRPI